MQLSCHWDPIKVHLKMVWLTFALNLGRSTAGLIAAEQMLLALGVR